MTKEPDVPVNGTPIPEDEDQAITTLRTVIEEWLLAMQLEGVQPVVAASQLIGALYDTLLPAMGRGAIRTALLMVYEKSHDEPMSFIERNDAKRALDQISNLRREVEGKPHLIVPGSDVKH